MVVRIDGRGGIGDQADPKYGFARGCVRRLDGHMDFGRREDGLPQPVIFSGRSHPVVMLLLLGAHCGRNNCGRRGAGWGC